MEANKWIITIFASIAIAILSYIIKHFYDEKINKRKEKLERVNRQLKDLYGPLLSLTSASKSAWTQFRKEYRSNTGNIKTHSYFKDNPPPTEEEKEIWRVWIISVFQPINEKIYNLIIENADLIIEKEFPNQFEKLCAHYETYKPVITEWNSENYKRHLSLIDYPTDLLSYAKQSYKDLKNKQEQLSN